MRAIEQFTSVHMGSALYPDVRTVGPSAGVERWTVPATSRLRHRGRLTTVGATWDSEDA